MASYVISQGEVVDPIRYDEYKAKAAPSIRGAGGRFIVRGGETIALEGEPPAERVVILEFPSRQAALDWYHSEEYTEIRRIRSGASHVKMMFVVDGVG